MRRLVLVATVAAGLALPAGARAQSKEDVARADALFNAAKALVDSGQYTDACAKFAESKRLAPGIGVTMYLADCYEHIGRTASAWTEFRSAEGLARERNDKRSELARTHAQQLEPRLDRLTISVAPTVARAGLQVLRDGVPVAQEELDLPIPVDPGDHAVVVSAPGHPARTFNAHVGPENPTATIRIDSLEEASQPVVVPPPIPVVEPPPPTGNPPSVAYPVAPPSTSATSTRRWIGIGVGAVGVVGLGVGSVFGLIAKSKLDQSNASAATLCDASTDRCYPPGFPIRKDAEHAATASDIAFAIGGVVLAAGIVLYVTAPRPEAPATGLVIAPMPLTAGGGAALSARF
jgi:hypothetical protein